MGKNGDNKAPDIHIPRIKTARVGSQGTDVVWQIEGEKAQRVPYEGAIQFAKAIMAKARQVEEQVKANQIVGDQAFLLSHGMPLKLTNNRDILREAAKEASQVRGTKIGTTQRIFTPSITQSPPKEAKDG